MTQKPDIAWVNIDRDGQYFVQGRVVDLKQLEDILVQTAANNPGRQTVIIRGDEASDLRHAVAVMNLCKKSRIQDCRIATDD